MAKTTDFWVGDRFVRPSLGEIQLGPERVHIEPRSMEVLLALAGSPSEVIPKKELIAAVWGDSFVSDEVLTHAIWDLRRAFGDNATDPEFIQTIPKMGYRLIAPVKAAEPAKPTPEKPGRRPSTRLVTWGLTLIVALIGGGFWLSRRQPVEPSPAPPPGSTALLLVPTEPPDGQPEWGLRLDTRLRNELSGIDGVVVRRSPLCRPAGDAERTYCLEPSLFSITDAQQLSLSLLAAGSGEEVYATPMTQVADGGELDAAAIEHADLVTAYFEVKRDRYSSDPDIQPWISTRRYDPRAIRDFLLGMKYVFRNETGGRDAMAAAIKRDASFIAPRVLRTPAILAEGDEATVAAHKADLERLYDNATAFEKAMITWAVATLERDAAVAIRQLRIAHQEAPGNRPVLLVLGSLLIGQGDLDKASRAFDELLDSGWDFPGLYPLAAHCAILRDELEDARNALELGLKITPVDPETLAQLRLLAVYDGDRQREESLGKRLETRILQMRPEIVELQYLGPIADYLASRAESEDRRPIADRLRESAD